MLQLLVTQESSSWRSSALHSPVRQGAGRTFGWNSIWDGFGSLQRPPAGAGAQDHLREDLIEPWRSRRSSHARG